MKLLLKWLLSAAALLLVAYLYSGVQVQSFTSALIAAFVIGPSNIEGGVDIVVLANDAAHVRQICPHGGQLAARRPDAAADPTAHGAAATAPCRQSYLCTLPGLRTRLGTVRALCGRCAFPDPVALASMGLSKARSRTPPEQPVAPR